MMSFSITEQLGLSSNASCNRSAHNFYFLPTKDIMLLLKHGFDMCVCAVMLKACLAIDCGGFVTGIIKNFSIASIGERT